MKRKLNLFVLMSSTIDLPSISTDTEASAALIPHIPHPNRHINRLSGQEGRSSETLVSIHTQEKAT